MVNNKLILEILKEKNIWICIFEDGSKIKRKDLFEEKFV